MLFFFIGFFQGNFIFYVDFKFIDPKGYIMIKIGIMGAMAQEVAHLKKSMIIASEETIAGRIYYSGTLIDAEIVLAFSHWGKVAAASTATTLINKFNVDAIIFTGVAGAVSEKLNIGDVVIGTGVYQHDMDARPFFEQFQIPLTNNIVFKLDLNGIDKATKASEFFLSTINHHIDSNKLTKFFISNPKVYTGIIASGDRFIADTLTHGNLKLPSENVLAVEMEGAAVAQVCNDYNIPFTVIRTISDKADHTASIDCLSFMNEIAGEYSAGIVQRMLRN